MKINFNSDDDLALNKQLKLYMLTIIVRTVFEEDGKYYPQIYLENCMNYKMLQYERIDVSEGTDLNKSDKSKECIICHYWYFKDIGYKYQTHVCNGCHGLSMVVYDINDFVILNIKGIDYRCYVFNMSKNDAINWLNSSMLDNKGVL